MIKWIYSLQVEHIAVVLKAQLQECNWFAFDEPFAVETKDWRWVAGQDFTADSLYEFGGLHEGVIL